MPRILLPYSRWMLQLLLVLAPLVLFSQERVELKPGKALRVGRIKGEKPNQLDVIKLDLLQLGINEARLFYEMEIGKRSSLEFGLGAIYKNGFWYERGDRPMLAYGGGVYLAYRIYMDKKRYFSEPKVRSYFSPMLFYRYSQYKNEWIAYTTSNPDSNDCELYSEKFHQVGAIVRFGWQTSRGRLVLDFYSGLGFKFIPSIRKTHVVTPSTPVCVVTDRTEAVGLTEKFYPTNVILNAGIKIGIRRNNKERHYEDAVPDQKEADPETPPQF
jgi:hypothetical protein